MVIEHTYESYKNLIGFLNDFERNFLVPARDVIRRMASERSEIVFTLLVEKFIAAAEEAADSLRLTTEDASEGVDEFIFAHNEFEDMPSQIRDLFLQTAFVWEHFLMEARELKIVLQDKREAEQRNAPFRELSCNYCVDKYKETLFHCTFEFAQFFALWFASFSSTGIVGEYFEDVKEKLKTTTTHS